MTLFRTPAGGYGYRFWHRGTLAKREGYATKGQARGAEWARRVEVGAVGPRQAGGPPTITLADYVARWLEEIAPHVAPKTLLNYRERLTGHVLATLGALALGALTRARIRALLTEKARTQAKQSVRGIRAALSACLADAAEAGLIVANPCLGIGRGRRRRGETLTAIERYERVKPMSLEERDAFLAVARTTEPAWAVYFELLAKTGLRPGEGLGLRRADLNATEASLRIERAWVAGVLRPTKTHETRVIDVPRGLAAALYALPPCDKSGWLFFNAAGRPRDLSKAGKAFRRARTAATLEGFRLYDLRHTYASLRLAAGAPITYVAAQLGHRTPETTLRYYARWMPSKGRAWVEDEPNPPVVVPEPAPKSKRLRRVK